MCSDTHACIRTTIAAPTCATVQLMAVKANRKFPSKNEVQQQGLPDKIQPAIITILHPAIDMLVNIFGKITTSVTVYTLSQVRYIGASNETSWGVSRFLQLAETQGLPRIVSIQNNYSMLVRVPFDIDLAEVCAPRQGNVGLLAYSPLAGGVLSGKYITGAATGKSRLNLFEGYMAR